MDIMYYVTFMIHLQQYEITKIKHNKNNVIIIKMKNKKVYKS